MPNFALLAVLAAAAASAVGCAAPTLEARLGEVERERDDLLRRNTELQARALSAEEREAALKREMTKKPAAVRTGTGPTGLDLPADLKGKGVGVRTRGNDTIIDLPSDVFFASGSARLSAEGEKALARLSGLIRKSYPGSVIRIEGHADSDPIRKTRSKYHCNWELSFERAHAVLHHMIDKAGFDPKRISADCFGEHQPVDPKNKSKNRRVEIVIART